jgi:hypothetical protein
LVAVLSEGVASAQVPAALVGSTAKAAAGQLAAASPAAVALMKEMFVNKLKIAAGAVVVVVALGAAGLAYQVGDLSGAAQAAPPAKPANELEELRKENELLKLNLQVVLEKLRAQETELADLRGRQQGPGKGMMGMPGGGGLPGPMKPGAGAPMGGTPGGGAPGVGPGGTAPRGGAPSDGGPGPGSGGTTLTPGGAPSAGAPGGANPFGGEEPSTGGAPDPVQEAESAIKALREAKDKDGQRRATEALEKAMKQLRQQLK